MLKINLFDEIMRRKIFFVFSLALFMDFSTKTLFVHHLLWLPDLPLIHWVVMHNSGILWGFYPKIGTLLGCLGFGMLTWLCHRYRLWHEAPIAATLLYAGALGNLYDRMVYGAVIDWILVGWDPWFWPAFNLADVYVVLGVALLLLHPPAHSTILTLSIDQEKL